MMHFNTNKPQFRAIEIPREQRGSFLCRLMQTHQVTLDMDNSLQNIRKKYGASFQLRKTRDDNFVLVHEREEAFPEAYYAKDPKTDVCDASQIEPVLMRWLSKLSGVQRVRYHDVEIPLWKRAWQNLVGKNYNYSVTW